MGLGCVDECSRRDGAVGGRWSGLAFRVGGGAGRLCLEGSSHHVRTTFQRWRLRCIYSRLGDGWGARTTLTSELPGAGLSREAPRAPPRRLL